MEPRLRMGRGWGRGLSPGAAAIAPLALGTYVKGSRYKGACSSWQGKGTGFD